MMKKLTEHEFSIKLISDATDTESPKCQIKINGSTTDSILQGAILEAAIKYQEFYLVFTTNDCPYEDTLNIHYLDQDLSILDQATLSWPYGTGSFTLLNSIQPNRIRFHFFEPKVWEISLYTKKQFFIPYFSEPRGVWRKFKFNRYFKIGEVTER
jgi:hypothetical protein